MMPVGPPTAAELLTHPEVIRALSDAWLDSHVDDPSNRHEEGGWIYLNLLDGAVATRRAPAGTRSRLSLANPPVLADHVIVLRHGTKVADQPATGLTTQDVVQLIVGDRSVIAPS